MIEFDNDFTGPDLAAGVQIGVHKDYGYHPLRHKKESNENVLVVSGPARYTDPSFDLSRSIHGMLSYQASSAWQRQKLAAFDQRVNELNNNITYQTLPLDIWPNLLADQMRVSLYNVSTKNCDNLDILENAWAAIQSRKPRYCVVMLDNWFTKKYFSNLLDLTESCYQEDSYQYKLKQIILTDLRLNVELILNEFVMPVLKKIDHTLNIAEQYETKLVIAQGVDPFRKLQEFDTAIGFAFKRYFDNCLDSKFKHFNSHPSIFKDFREHLFLNEPTLQWPFTDLPNTRSHRWAADQLYNSLENNSV